MSKEYQNLSEEEKEQQTISLEDLLKELDENNNDLEESEAID
jgi:hypothetical protein